MDTCGGVAQLQTKPTRRSSFTCEWPRETMAPAAVARGGDIHHEHPGRATTPGFALPPAHGHAHITTIEGSVPCLGPLDCPFVEQQVHQQQQQQIDEQLWPLGSGPSAQVGCREQPCAGHVEPRVHTDAAAGGDAMDVCGPQQPDLQQQGGGSRQGSGASKRGSASGAQRVGSRRGRGQSPRECAPERQQQDEVEVGDEEDGQQGNEDEEGAEEEEEQQALPGPVTVRVMTKSRRVRRMDSDDDDCYWDTSVTGTFLPDLYLAGGPCIRHKDALVTRSQFEKLSGITTAKWHISIKVMPSGVTLGSWLRSHGLPVVKGKPRAIAGRRSQNRADSSDSPAASGRFQTSPPTTRAAAAAAAAAAGRASAEGNTTAATATAATATAAMATAATASSLREDHAPAAPCTAPAAGDAPAQLQQTPRPPQPTPSQPPLQGTHGPAAGPTRTITDSILPVCKLEEQPPYRPHPYTIGLRPSRRDTLHGTLPFPSAPLEKANQPTLQDGSGLPGHHDSSQASILALSPGAAAPMVAEEQQRSATGRQVQPLAPYGTATVCRNGSVYGSSGGLSPYGTDGCSNGGAGGCDRRGGNMARAVAVSAFDVSKALPHGQANSGRLGGLPSLTGCYQLSTAGVDTFGSSSRYTRAFPSPCPGAGMPAEQPQPAHRSSSSGFPGNETLGTMQLKPDMRATQMQQPQELSFFSSQPLSVNAAPPQLFHRASSAVLPNFAAACDAAAAFPAAAGSSHVDAVAAAAAVRMDPLPRLTPSELRSPAGPSDRNCLREEQMHYQQHGHLQQPQPSMQQHRWQVPLPTPGQQWQQHQDQHQQYRAVAAAMRSPHSGSRAPGATPLTAAAAAAGACGGGVAAMDQDLDGDGVEGFLRELFSDLEASDSPNAAHALASNSNGSYCANLYSSGRGSSCPAAPAEPAQSMGTAPLSAALHTCDSIYASASSGGAVFACGGEGDWELASIGHDTQVQQQQQSQQHSRHARGVPATGPCNVLPSPVGMPDHMDCDGLSVLHGDAHRQHQQQQQQQQHNFEQRSVVGITSSGYGVASDVHTSAGYLLDHHQHQQQQQHYHHQQQQQHHQLQHRQQQQRQAAAARWTVLDHLRQKIRQDARSPLVDAPAPPMPHDDDPVRQAMVAERHKRLREQGIGLPGSDVATLAALLHGKSAVLGARGSQHDQHQDQQHQHQLAAARTISPAVPQHPQHQRQGQPLWGDLRKAYSVPGLPALQGL